MIVDDAAGEGQTTHPPANGAGRNTRRGRRRAHGGPRRLPLRWAVILTLATAAGVVTAHLAGPLAGVSAAATLAGVLHAILD